jgi:hypothetical protein
MRIALAIVALLAIAPLSSSPAKADPYRWCAVYGDSNGGRNCGFVTLQQCRAAISGDNQAICEPNPFYDGRPIRTR